MFERFTDRARHVVIVAHDEARLLHHDCTGTEHLLLALMAEYDSVAARALTDLGISRRTVRQQVEEIIGHGEPIECGPTRFTPRAKRVFELALRESLRFGHGYIGTEHLLLGLIREGEGVAAQILRMFGADLTCLRREVIRELSMRPARA